MGANERDDNVTLAYTNLEIHLKVTAHISHPRFSASLLSDHSTQLVGSCSAYLTIQASEIDTYLLILQQWARNYRIFHANFLID